MNPLEAEIAIANLQDSGDYRILRRVNLNTDHRFTRKSTPNNKIVLVIDTETTGFDSDKDKIIEVGIVAVEFNPASGEIVRVAGRYSGFEDPGHPLDQVIIDVTGITDDMLAGKTFNDGSVQQLAGSASLVVAHNSGFDRPFMENRFPVFKNIPWACSLAQIDWKAERISAKVLEYILFKFGWCINAHRALDDAEGLLCVLMETLPVSKQSAFMSLLNAASEPVSRIYAINAPFDRKDILKQRGYRWSDGTSSIPKCWWTIVSESQETEELEFLASDIYPGGNTKHVVIKRVGPLDRFSKRDA